MRATLLYQPLDNLKILLNAGVQNSEVHGYDTTDDSSPAFQPLYGYLEQKRYTPESLELLTQMVSSEVQWDTQLGNLVSATSYSAFKSRQALDLTPDAAFFPPGLVSTVNPCRGNRTVLRCPEDTGGSLHIEAARQLRIRRWSLLSARGTRTNNRRLFVRYDGPRKSKRLPRQRRQCRNAR